MIDQLKSIGIERMANPLIPMRGRGKYSRRPLAKHTLGSRVDMRRPFHRPTMKAVTGRCQDRPNCSKGRRPFSPSPMCTPSMTAASRSPTPISLLSIYLNGEEIYRWNMPMPLGSPLDENLSALQSLPNISLCVTSQPIQVTNLLPGKNWLAARVHQFNDDQQDVAFGLEFDAAYLQASLIGISNGPANNLRVTITNPPDAAASIKITWPNSSPNLPSRS